MASLYTGNESIAKTTDWPEIQTGGSLLLAFQLKNRRVLLVGGGNVAADRLRSVLPADARVTLICPVEGMGTEVAYRVSRKAEYGIEVREREFRDEDVTEEAWDMVLTALDDPELSKHIYSLCKARHYTINVADVPPLCDFYFGSVIRRGPLQIMVSTNGKGPRLANRIRRQIEQGLPKGVGEAIERIGTLRAQLRKRAPGSDAEKVKRRMEFMVRVTDSWSMDELASMTAEQQSTVLESFEEDYARSYTSATGSYWRRALCPYWMLNAVNPLFWLRRGILPAETIETRRQSCPVWRAKSTPSSALLLACVFGSASGISAAFTYQILKLILARRKIT